MTKNPIVEPTTPTKIGIIGPKEVGKTALANLINGHLKLLGVSSDLVHESARRCPLPLNEKTTIGAAYWLLGAQIAAEALVQETRQFTVCDRTVIDLYPFALYSAANSDSTAGKATAATRGLQPLRTLIQDYLTARPYEFLFYVPIRQELWNMYSPPDDPPFQALIDAEFRKFLGELQINFIELKSLDGHQRLEEIISALETRYRFRNRIIK